MAEKKLNLVQFSAGQLAQTGTGAPKIVRRQRGIYRPTTRIRSLDE